VPVITVIDPNDIRLEPYRNIRDRDLAGREGRFMAEGKVVLSVLLQSDAFSAESVLVLESRLAGLMPLLANADADLPVYCVPQGVMDGLAGFHMHRGIMAIARRRTDAVALDALTFGPDALVVVAQGMSNHDNMGALFRNAAAFEADMILLDEQCCDPLYRKAIRVSVGAVLKVPFRRGDPLVRIAGLLKQQGFHLAALSPSGRQSITGLPKSGRRAIILGSEGPGLPPGFLESASVWSIPMSSTFDSLNVATAAAMALFHSSRFSKPD
jgi:tRNA G18 (ribose-2'-O)-methylase SpoU